MADEKITVYVANLGRYDEGVLQGGWLELPVGDAELNRFLKDTVGLDDRYEEYAIHDYERTGLVSAFDIAIGEHSSLHDLNLLAQVVEARSGEDSSVIEEVAGAREAGAVSGDPIALANLAMQSDDIPFNAYEADGDFDSLEERYAYSLVESGAAPEVKDVLDGPLGGYFDVEAWGRDASMDVTLCENGYYDNQQESPDETMYSRDELREYVAGDRATDSPRPFSLESLVGEHESIAEYTLTGDGTNWGSPSYRCVIADGSTDIAAALEDTLGRIIADRADAGADDADEVVRETMGAERYDDASDIGAGSIIDRGWVLPGAISSFDRVMPSPSGVDPADPMSIAMTGGPASGLAL